MWEERINLREELLNKKEPEFDDLENSQSIQITKDAIIKRVTFRP